LITNVSRSSTVFDVFAGTPGNFFSMDLLEIGEICEQRVHVDDCNRIRASMTDRTDNLISAPEAFPLEYPTVGTQLARYELLDSLGEGGMGHVFKVRDTVSQEIVAMKVLPRSRRYSADDRDRFAREIRIVSELDVDDVVKIYESGEADGWLFYTMELIEGESLKQLIAAGHTALAERLGIAVDLSAILTEIHSRNICHRDIKPSNIMRRTDGRCVYIDFGIAKDLGTDTDPELTATGARLGVPWYMSPESKVELKDNPDLERRADVYSLAVTIYELLSNDLPYKVRNLDDDEVREVVRRDDPAALREKNPDIPRPVAAAVMWGLSKQCVGEEKRPDARMFHDCLGGRLVAPKPATGWKRWRIAAALLMLAAIGSGGWLWSQQEETGDPRPTPTVKPIAAGPLLLWLDAHPQALDAKWRHTRHSLQQTLALKGKGALLYKLPYNVRVDVYEGDRRVHELQSVAADGGVIYGEPAAGCRLEILGPDGDGPVKINWQPVAGQVDCLSIGE